MSENLADLGAIKTILATHKRLVKEKDLESLPGLTHLSHEQIMLIQAAQVSIISNLFFASSLIQRSFVGFIVLLCKNVTGFVLSTFAVRISSIPPSVNFYH